MPVRRGADPVADGDADMLHDAVVAVAVDHARRAAVTQALRAVELRDLAERPVPVVASVKVQVPAQVEELPSRETIEVLGFAAQMTLHVVD
jgi:hypothetical protein